MKLKIFSVISIIVIFTMSLSGCGNSTKITETIARIENLILNGDMEKAYGLCNETLSSDITSEQGNEIVKYQKLILDSCYSGTFIIKMDRLTKVIPAEVGKNSYFTVGILKNMIQFSADILSQKKVKKTWYLNNISNT